ncbi:unnamed protein product [Pleuronectes platessa]|uniref:Uncharacterized protein n=1 Tax=Pleuronectes platessa TaxID=8262 RepID=A0A9N7Y6G4_PLEPL|nr:unnamed protein product [Pleuronectes platessa]
MLKTTRQFKVRTSPLMVKSPTLSCGFLCIDFTPVSLLPFEFPPEASCMRHNRSHIDRAPRRGQSVESDPPSVSTVVSASVPHPVSERRASRGERAASALAWLPGSPPPKRDLTGNSGRGSSGRGSGSTEAPAGPIMVLSHYVLSTGNKMYTLGYRSFQLGSSLGVGGRVSQVKSMLLWTVVNWLAPPLGLTGSPVLQPPPHRFLLPGTAMKQCDAVAKATQVWERAAI